MIKKIKKLKVRTQLLLLILSAGTFCFLLFHSLWWNKYPIWSWAEEHFHPNSPLNDDQFWSNLYEEALKYNVPESDTDKSGNEQIEPFFQLADKYTGIYIYGLEDGTYRAGKVPEVMNEEPFRYFYYLGYRITDGEGESTHSFPVKFKNETAMLTIAFYHNSIFVYPYFIIIFLLCAALFLLIIIVFVSRKMKYVVSLEQEILLMASGDLNHPVPLCGADEIGILAQELDQMRLALSEHIQQEQASRKANQDLITAMSHDLRTPLTILNGYLEILKLGRNPQMQEEYLHRCLNKTRDIQEMTDRMFEYALVFQEVEAPELTKLPSGLLLQCLEENCDFIRLAGFKVHLDFPISETSFLGDETMIKRIFSNLFSNILKYGDKKEPVCVTSSLNNDQLNIRLHNTAKREYSSADSNHIGLKSVEKMLKILGGSLTLTESSGLFATELSFQRLS